MPGYSQLVLPRQGWRWLGGYVAADQKHVFVKLRRILENTVLDDGIELVKTVENHSPAWRNAKWHECSSHVSFEGIYLEFTASADGPGAELVSVSVHVYVYVHVHVHVYVYVCVYVCVRVYGGDETRAIVITGDHVSQ